MIVVVLLAEGRRCIRPVCRSRCRSCCPCVGARRPKEERPVFVQWVAGLTVVAQRIKLAGAQSAAVLVERRSCHPGRSIGRARRVPAIGCDRAGAGTAAVGVARPVGAAALPLAIGCCSQSIANGSRRTTARSNGVWMVAPRVRPSRPVNAETRHHAACPQSANASGAMAQVRGS